MAYDLTNTFNFDNPVSIDSFKSEKQDVWTGIWAGANSISLATMNESLVTKIKRLPSNNYFLPDEFDKRPDRLAREYYSSYDYTVIVLIQADVSSWDQFRSRRIIQLASKADIETLLIRN